MNMMDQYAESIRGDQNYMTSIENWINFYRNQGFSIIPLKERDKRPNIDSWQQYQKKPPTNEEILQWIESGLFQNIGIICGNVSNNLVVIDIDKQDILEKLGLKVETLIARGHWVIKTGRGYHIYCRNNGNPGGIVKDDKLHIEYRANGGYCVAPPSIHPNGSEYKFLYQDGPETLKDLKSENVKKVFNDMITKLGGKPAQICTKPAIPAIKKGVTYGSRNDSAFKLACQYRDGGLTIEEATKLLMDWNRKNKPPLPDNEWMNCLKSAYKKEPEIKDEQRELLKKYKVIKYKKIKDGEGNEYYVPGGIRCQNMADMIIKELGYHFITLEEKAKPIWYFNGKYYKPNGEIKIGEILETFIPKLFTKTILTEVITYIQYNNIKTRLDFIPPLNLINLENGIYDLNTGEIEKHSYKYLFNYVIPIDYDPDAKCPQYEKFLKQITRENGVERPEVYNTLQEYLGYCFYRDYEYKKYLVMDGENDNGKTTLMNIWIKVLGEKNIASIPLQELNDKAFRKDKLYGKHGNFADELPNKGMRYSNVIKEVTGKSPIWADIKNHQEGVWFINYAKPFFTCNQIPETNDIGNAFFSRQLQITLHNKYLPEKNPNIDDKTCFVRNTEIEKEITTPEEISGIFNHAMKGLKRLRKNKRFSDTTTTEEKRRIWLKKSDPIMSYFNEEIEETTIDWCITCKNLKQEIEQYCKKNNITIDLTLNKITRKLSDLDIIKTRKTIYDQRKWVFLGIKHITDSTINEYIGKKNENYDMELPI